MLRLVRSGLAVIAPIALPTAAIVLGFHNLRERDRPPAPPTLDAAAIVASPRPAIDLTKPTVVVLLGTDLTEITDALGPYEMFARAGKYNVVTVAAVRQPSVLTGGLSILPHYSLSEIDSIVGGRVDVVVVPNLPNADKPLNRPAIEWIRRQAAAGALIHSWCKGAMALAETGLLDGETATAHWGDIPTLEKRYPKVKWVRGVRWIDRGQFVMSAGITSGIDATLRVLIQIAGDSVARRVALEIRYPNYHFAIDPRVEQYQLEPADLVLLANIAFRFRQPTLGIALYDGVGEFDLSNVYDAHVHLAVVRAETVANDAGPIVTEHGLTLYPSLSLKEARVSTRLGAIDRLIIPGTLAREHALALVASINRATPSLRAEHVHADQPDRFGLEPVIEDLARTADVPTARFALKRMEYRSNSIRFDGPALPWEPIVAAVSLALLGTLLAQLGRVMRRRHKASCGASETDRK